MRKLTVILLVIMLVGCGDNNPIAEIELLPTPVIGEETVVAATPTIAMEPTATVGDPTTLPEAGESDIEPEQVEEGWPSRDVFQAGLVSSERSVLDGLAGATMYRLVWEIDESLTQLMGQAEILYTNQEEVSLNELYFHLLPAYLGGTMTFEGVMVEGHTTEIELLYGGGIMKVPLADTLPPNEQVIITMSYDLAIPDGTGEGFGMLSFSEDVLSLAHAYPMVAVYDEVTGWHNTPPFPGGDVTFGDSAFFVVEVTLPAGITTVTVGNEIARDGQTITYSAGPVRDFYLAASDRFEHSSRTVGETTINSYVLPDIAETNDLVLDYAEDSLVIFNEQLGQYPYTELDIVSTDLSAFGLEFPGIFAITMPLYEENGRYPLVVLESTVVHENAHQWFYSTVGNDQLNEPWLDEALAQYATLLYFEERYGPAGADGFRQSLVDRWNRVDQAEIPIGLPVGSYEDGTYVAIVYGRGPLFVEALAEEMGQAEFAKFLQTYYATYKWDIATTADFQVLAESVCDCDLGDLFADWVGG